MLARKLRECPELQVGRIAPRPDIALDYDAQLDRSHWARRARAPDTSSKPSTSARRSLAVVGRSMTTTMSRSAGGPRPTEYGRAVQERAEHPEADGQDHADDQELVEAVEDGGEE